MLVPVAIWRLLPMFDVAHVLGRRADAIVALPRTRTHCTRMNGQIECGVFRDTFASTPSVFSPISITQQNNLEGSHHCGDAAILSSTV
jgi:hypothetical protein